MIQEPFVPDCQLNVYNLASLLGQPRTRYGALRFDPNNTCNLHCVYCHNHRSDDVIALDQFRLFLIERVSAVDYFQIGCIMEPTLDRRLCDFLSVIEETKPGTIVLQTNGTLLNRHDHARMGGIGRLSISLDTADPATQKSLRDGVSLDRVLRNVSAFMEHCPEVAVDFISVVTRSNIEQIDTLIELGLERGVRTFILREVLYYPSSNIVDHERMPALLLHRGEFSRMKARLSEKYGNRSTLHFAPNEALAISADNMARDSNRTSLPKAQFHS